MHIQVSKSANSQSSFPAACAHTVHFLNAVGLAGVLQVLPGRRVSFCNFLLQKKRAGAPRRQTEKRINQAARDLLWAFLQVYETTAGAQKKCHGVKAPLFFWEEDGGELKRKGHLQFLCLTTFPSNSGAARLCCAWGADDSLFISCACRRVYSRLLKTLALQTLLHLPCFKYASNPTGVNCQQPILGATTLPPFQD